MFGGFSAVKDHRPFGAFTPGSAVFADLFSHGDGFTSLSCVWSSTAMFWVVNSVGIFFSKF
jgi:hypothetical protein